MNRWIAVSGPLAGALILAAALAFGIARYAWNRATAGAIAGLLDDVQRGMDELKPGVAPTPLEELPAPVERYFTFALPHGQPRIRTARIRWSGEFQSRPGGGWEPFRAWQHFTTEPPGFVWDAQIHMLPMTSVRVRDAYQSGNGTMVGRIGGLLPVVEEGGTPEMAQSALARWLGEAAWFPTALLPGSFVRWKAVDDSTARATVSDGSVQASADFHFAASGEITRFTAMRYRDADGTAVLTPFEGRYGPYERHSGVMIPAEAEVAWQLPEGRYPYWRGRPEEVDFEVIPPMYEAPAP